VRLAAASALVRINPGDASAAVPVLRRLLKDERQATRDAAAEALKEAGAAGGGAADR
jgi:HEAT repeat protein